MTDLLIALCTVFLVVMGGKAFIAWPAYRGSVYQQLFGSFLEYYWKYTVNQDLSRSGYLDSELGPHRLLYNAYRDANGREANQFVTVLTTHGVATVCAVHTTGVVSGGDTGAWHIERDGARYTLASSLIYMRRQQKFLAKALGKTRVSCAIVFDDGADLSGVSCSCPTMHVGELVAWLKGLDDPISEQDVTSAFEAIKAQMTRN